METPELDKIKKVGEISQEIGNFLDWLLEIGYHIGEFKKFDEFDEEQFVAVYLNREEILARYFGIDLKKVEEEKLAILKEHEEK